MQSSPLTVKKKKKRHFLKACLWALGMSFVWKQRLSIQRWQKNHLPLSSTHECHEYRPSTPPQQVLDTEIQPIKSRITQSSGSWMKACVPKEKFEWLLGPTPRPHYHGPGEPLGKCMQRRLTILSSLFIANTKAHADAASSRGVSPPAHSQMQQGRASTTEWHRIACPAP